MKAAITAVKERMNAPLVEPDACPEYVFINESDIMRIVPAFHLRTGPLSGGI